MTHITTTPAGTSVESAVRLTAAAAGRSPYAPAALRGPIDLFLDANEGPSSSIDTRSMLATTPADAFRRYPDAAPIEQMLAARFSLEASRVIVTAGEDDAIDRACRVCLEPGRSLILPVPTFEMIARSAQMLGARVETTPWPGGPYPIDAVLALINDRTSMLVVVSPNNPTGAVAAASDLRRLAEAAPHALLLVDLAYTEFADDDLTAAALTLPNAVVVRTFSKAMGLAGLRVGYALGNERVIRAMRAVGAPYPVSSLSLAVAAGVVDKAAESAQRANARVRSERGRLTTLLEHLGATPHPSQANFVLAEFDDAEWVWRALGGLGIAVRRFPATPGLENALRITCPGDEYAFDRLCNGLRAALQPQAILFDMVGVLADVSSSRQRTIALTAESFGAHVTPPHIAATLIPDRAMLEQLSRRFALGIVTGRPRRECDQFLNRFKLDGLFRAVVCMEDAPLKPDPAPVRLLLDRLGVQRAWLIGATPDDIIAARRAAVIPVGLVPPGADAAETTESLARAGAVRTLSTFSDLLELLS